MGEKNNGILEKTSPNSPFIIHHSSFIIHHSSFITSSISTSPKFLRSPFFQTAKLLPKLYLLKKKGHSLILNIKRDSSHSFGTWLPRFAISWHSGVIASEAKQSPPFRDCFGAKHLAMTVSRWSA